MTGFKRYRFLITLLSLLFVTAYAVGQQANQIDLAGTWQFREDPLDKGITEQWFNTRFDDHIKLPGSMLTNSKGNEVTLFTKWTGSIYDSSWYFNPRFEKYRQPGNLHFPFWLTPAKHYVGAAWYRKEINIPAGWNDKHMVVFLERCHTETMLWIDDQYIGMQNSLVAPHEYVLQQKLPPGKHSITIRVDNRIKEVNVGPDSHSLTDHTQGNWNGIIGKMLLQAKPAAYIGEVQIYPDVKNNAVRIVLETIGVASAVRDVRLFIAPKGEARPATKPAMILLSNLFQHNSKATTTISLGKEIEGWNEFNPKLYTLSAELTTRSGDKEIKRIDFGMRNFRANGRHFAIYGLPVFLRGTVDCCVFPLTGYPPMDVEAWEKMFRIAKSHGLNHMRFHSWCPPEAAFAAADHLGFYLQVEAPTWPNHGVSLGDGKSIDAFIMEEANRMMQYYGNHPSFCMLAAGNEPAGRNQAKYLAGFVEYWKAKDSRHVYTGASVGMSWPLVPENEYMVKSGARNLNWNNAAPESMSDYSAAVADFSVPYVTHEMGQWCVFPDFTEIPKYTGAYKANNFEMFKEDLQDQGMGDQAHEFFMASGALQLLCYKNEIEKTLRTKDLAGFQLLGLQDFPGQGTALVGTVNPFWEDKTYSSPGQFRAFCNATVPLLRTKKFTYTNNETLQAEVEVFHFAQATLNNQEIFWRVKDSGSKVIHKESFTAQNILNGANTPVGRINLNLSEFHKASAITLEVGFESYPALTNKWNFWIYPSNADTAWAVVYYTDTLDATSEKILADGGKVFLNLAGKVMKGKEIAQAFLPVFWNTSWFKMRPPHTLGFILDDKHPAFKSFPTSAHSDLQWWGIVNKAQVMHLEDFPPDFRPLVQPIDTWFLNRRLGLIFEASVGGGSIIVSSANLGKDDGPAALQLLASLQQYMNSAQFHPVKQISVQTIKNLTALPSRYVFDAYTKSGPDELRPIQPINNNKHEK